MRSEQISTSSLLQRLFKTNHLGRFIRHYEKQLDSVTFSEYINQLCAYRGVAPAQIIKKSNIERTFGHQLFNGRRTPSRDKVIQLAFGFEMDYDETQALLKTACKSPLYPKVKRDAVVIYALKRGFGIMEVQATLDELSLPLLGKDERKYD